MSGVEEILSALPIDQLAAKLSADPQEVEQAAAAAIPALLGGMQANTQDPSGEASLLEALGQHSPSLYDGGVDLGQVDTDDGARISGHVFGDQQDQVVNQLGGLGSGGSALIRKLLPILAPIVLSYIVKQMQNRGAAPGGSSGGSGGSGDSSGGSEIRFPGQEDAAGSSASSASSASSGTSGGGSPGGDLLSSILQQVLTGALQGAGGGRSSGSAGNILGDLLGGLLGGGRR